MVCKGIILFHSSSSDPSEKVLFIRPLENLKSILQQAQNKFYFFLRSCSWGNFMHGDKSVQSKMVGYAEGSDIVHFGGRAKKKNISA